MPPFSASISPAEPRAVRPHVEHPVEVDGGSVLPRKSSGLTSVVGKRTVSREAEPSALPPVREPSQPWLGERPGPAPEEVGHPLVAPGDRGRRGAVGRVPRVQLQGERRVGAQQLVDRRRLGGVERRVGRAGPARRRRRPSDRAGRASACEGAARRRRSSGPGRGRPPARRSSPWPPARRRSAHGSPRRRRPAPSQGAEPGCTCTSFRRDVVWAILRGDERQLVALDQPEDRVPPQRRTSGDDVEHGSEVAL